MNTLMICQAIVHLLGVGFNRMAWAMSYSEWAGAAYRRGDLDQYDSLMYRSEELVRLSHKWNTAANALTLLLLAAPRPTSQLSPTMKKAILQMAAHPNVYFNTSNGVGTAATYVSLFRQGLIEMDDVEAWKKGRFVVYRLTDSGRRVAENLAGTQSAAITPVSVAVELPDLKNDADDWCNKARRDFDDKQATEYIAAKIKRLQAVLVIDLDGADICEDCIEARLDDCCPMCAGSGEAWVRVSELIDPRSPYGLKPEHCQFCQGTGKR